MASQSQSQPARTGVTHGNGGRRHAIRADPGRHDEFLFLASNRSQSRCNFRIGEDQSRIASLSPRGVVGAWGTGHDWVPLRKSPPTLFQGAVVQCAPAGDGDRMWLEFRKEKVRRVVREDKRYENAGIPEGSRSRSRTWGWVREVLPLI